MQIENVKKHKMSNITVSEFLERYYGFPSNSFPNVTHSDLNGLLPYVEKSSKEVDFSKKLYTGEVVLVKDCKGKVMAYNNPVTSYGHIFDNSNVEIIFTVDDTDFVDFNEDDIPYMSKHELEEALEYFKLIKDTKKVRKIINEFNYRPKTGCRKRKLETVLKKERIEE